MALIDEQIQDAMRKGQFANLPGTGKPLRLEDDSHVPETMRMANKLMRDNDLVPEWMMQGKELDAARDQLLRDIQRMAQRETSSAVAVESLRAGVKRYNSRVLSYNLKVPKGVAHKRHLDFEQELRRLG